MEGPKFSAGLWVFGGCADRFCRQGYTKPLSLEEQIEVAAQAEGVEAIECHQADFDTIAIARFNELLEERGLICTNVNTDVWSDPKWKWGAYTNRDPKLRQAAIDEGKRAVDIARQIGAPSIGQWLGSDGFDYPFQVDYTEQWELIIDGLRQVAEHAAPDIKVGIEYKLKEPRTHMTIGSVGKTMSIILELGMENVGGVIDFGHALMSGENPGESVAYLARHGKLFNVHFNDAYGHWDDDMIPGTIHFWETLEFLYYCKRTGYDGYFGLDMFPYREDGARAAEMAIANIKALWKLLGKLDVEALLGAQRTMDALASQEIVRKMML